MATAETSTSPAQNLQSLQEIFSGGVQQFLIAIVTLLLGFVIGKILGKLIEKIFKAAGADDGLKKTAGITYPISELIGAIISYTIYAITILLVLKQLHLTEQAINIVGIITLIIVTAAIILGIKDFVPNFMSGIFLHTHKYIEEGDTIKFREIEGKVTRISLIETTVETKTKELIYVPNSLLTKSEVLKIRKKKYGEA